MFHSGQAPAHRDILASNWLSRATGSDSTITTINVVRIPNGDDSEFRLFYKSVSIGVPLGKVVAGFSCEQAEEVRIACGAFAAKRLIGARIKRVLRIERCDFTGTQSHWTDGAGILPEK